MDKTLLVITTYNQSKYTKMCFESLKTVDEDIDVLVVDDYSSDDTIELCNNYGYEVIKKTKPMGLTHSWNLGYQRFKTYNYDYLILANNDVLIPNGSISELLRVHNKWPFTLVVPLTTTSGAGHNSNHQSVSSHYDGLTPMCDDPNNYQVVQDRLIDIKNNMKRSNNLNLVDPYRMKMFNGFFFMCNKNIINYEFKNDILFDPINSMTKNEDDINWRGLLSHNDYSAVCKTSFVFHFKGVTAVGSLRNNKEWEEERFKNETD